MTQYSYYEFVANKYDDDVMAWGCCTCTVQSGADNVDDVKHVDRHTSHQVHQDYITTHVLSES